MRLTLLLLIPFFLLFNSCEGTKSKELTTQSSSKEKDINKEAEKLLRHVVLFNFKDTATPSKVKEIEEAFASLPSKIPEIHSFEWGTNNSPEGLDKNLTHCFLVTFTSENDRTIYLPHPAHKEFVKLVEPYVEDVTVVDYWAQ